MQLQFSKVFPDMEQDIPELPLASFSKRVLVFNLSPDCKFFIHSTYFHTNGRASGLVLKEGVKGNSEMAYCSLNPEIRINILLICYFLRNVVQLKFWDGGAWMSWKMAILSNPKVRTHLLLCCSLAMVPRIPAPGY